MNTSLHTPQPADFADVRATNLAVVLRYVRAHAPCSRADIAAATGLNKATVSSLVSDLIARRLLRETGLTEHRIGRPATKLVLDSAYAAVGLDIGADHLTAVALDLTGGRLLSWRRSFAAADSPPGRTVAALTALTRRALGRVARDGRRPLGVTVGVPGLVSPHGVVEVAATLGWRDVDLRDRLTRALRGTGYAAQVDNAVQVDNDANLAAAAEYRWGAHAGTGNLVYVSGQGGLGAGAVVDGTLLQGARGFAGELGHVPLDPAGPACVCGAHGCLQALAGVAQLLQRAAPDTFAEGAPTDWEPEVAEVRRRAQAGDTQARTALTDAGSWLGRGAAVLANLLNPEVIVLGGYYATLAPWLLPAARRELASRTLAPDAGGAQLVAGGFGRDAAAVGGAAQLLAAVDAGRLPPAGEDLPATVEEAPAGQ